MAEIFTSLHGAHRAAWGQARPTRIMVSGRELIPAEERISAHWCTLLLAVEGTRGCGKAPALLVDPHLPHGKSFLGPGMLGGVYQAALLGCPSGQHWLGPTQSSSLQTHKSVSVLGWKLVSKVCF